MIRNRIVTRGLSKTTRNLLVTRGFIPGIFQRISEAIFRPRGRSAPGRRKPDECDEFTIKVSLVRVNDVYLVRPISNKITVIVCPNPSLFVRATQGIRTAVIETIRTILIKAGILRWKR